MTTTPSKRRGPNVWVVVHNNGFSVKLEGHGFILIPPTIQSTAITVARELARANNSELIVQGRSTRIRFRDSHGNDPFPPRG